VPEGPKLRSTHSLRSQIVALVVALVVPMLALQAWWSFNAYEGARERAWTDALAFADATSLSLRQFLAQSEELMIAHAAQSREGVVSGRDRCTEEMRGLVRTLPFLANALTIAPDGEILCSAQDAPAGASGTEWPWFGDFSRQPRFMVGPPVMGDFTKSWVLPLVAPLWGPDDVVLGAIVGTVPLLELNRLFSGVQRPEGHLITIATGDDVVVARSHDAETWLGQPLPAKTGADRVVGPGRSFADGPDLTGVERTWGQVENEIGWLVYVGVPSDIVYGPARAEALRHVAATLLVLVVGVLLAWRAYRRIAGALAELADRTRRAAVGDVIPPPSGTPTEFLAVIDQFNYSLGEQQKAEGAERAVRERFQSIFDNAVFGLYVATRDSFVEVNPALVAMLGYESSEHLIEVGPDALYLDPSVRTRLVTEWIENAQVRKHEVDWLRADGTTITVRIAGKVIGDPSEEPLFEMVVQDITAERRTEEELRQTQKMEALGKLAGGIAHDFNNLLTVIGGNAELLDDDLQAGHPLRADLSQITKATSRAASLTRRLLAFSRKGPRVEQSLDLNESLRALDQMLARVIGESTTLQTDLEAGPFQISIDPGDLEQVVLNLVLNARDSMPAGGLVTLATRAAPVAGIDTPTGTGTPGVTLTVTDTGSGMDDAVRLRMFEPFFTTKPMGEGTGLGLSTVYGIVSRGGGSITVQSQPDQGTRIEIWFPLSAGTSDAVPPADAPRAGVSGYETVLVVEDEDLVRDFVARALREAGYVVVSAKDGQEALEFLRSTTGPVDLVLTDVVMPRLGGPKLAQRLAVLMPEAAVLFMSGYVDNPFLQEALDEDMDRLLQKPFSVSALRVAVRRALDRRVAARATH